MEEEGGEESTSFFILFCEMKLQREKLVVCRFISWFVFASDVIGEGEMFLAGPSMRILLNYF